MGKKIDGLFPLLAGAVGLAMIALPGPASAGNLIVNGGFETQDPDSNPLNAFPGWTATPNPLNSSWQDNTTDFYAGGPHSGDWFALFGPTLPDQSLSQSFTATAGAHLHLGFYLASDGATPNLFSVNLNGNLLDLSPVSNLDYAFYSLDATAVGGLNGNTLTFAFMDAPGWLALDDVSVTVPEPASLGLLGIALAGFGFMRRRRRGA